jgi:hypothetical protein
MHQQTGDHAMNTSRRGFLGSILGAYVTTQLPWYARLAADPVQEITSYRSVLVLTNGTKIQGPKLKLHDIGPETTDFTFEALEIRRPLVIAKSIILGPTGHEISRSDLMAGPMTFHAGDELHLTYRMETQHVYPFSEVTTHRPKRSMERIWEENQRKP